MPYEVRKTAEFGAWIDGLTDRIARKAIVDRIVRIEGGLLGDRKSVGDRVSELRVDVGQGYRLYYTRLERVIVLLLCGGTKKGQKSDQEGTGTGGGNEQGNEGPARQPRP